MGFHYYLRIALVASRLHYAAFRSRNWIETREKQGQGHSVKEVALHPINVLYVHPSSRKSPTIYGKIKIAKWGDYPENRILLCARSRGIHL